MSRFYIQAHAEFETCSGYFPTYQTHNLGFSKTVKLFKSAFNRRAVTPINPIPRIDIPVIIII